MSTLLGHIALAPYPRPYHNNQTCSKGRICEEAILGAWYCRSSQNCCLCMFVLKLVPCKCFSLQFESAEVMSSLINLSTASGAKQKLESTGTHQKNVKKKRVGSHFTFKCPRPPVDKPGLKSQLSWHFQCKAFGTKDRWVPFTSHMHIPCAKCNPVVKDAFRFRL